MVYLRDGVCSFQADESKGELRVFYTLKVTISCVCCTENHNSLTENHFIALFSPSWLPPRPGPGQVLNDSKNIQILTMFFESFRQFFES